MNRFKFASLVVVSIVSAILLATALNSITHVSDSALAESSPFGHARGGIGTENRPSIANTNYLPIIFLNSATSGGAWLLAGNAGTNSLTDFLGTTGNMTLTLRVSNTIAYRIVPAVDPTWGFAPNLIGGSPTSQVSPGLMGATIAGGGASSYPNVINGGGTYAFIGGGQFNTVGGHAGTIVGGKTNRAGGVMSFVGGGEANTAGGLYSAIGGGDSNTASGIAATVPGGAQNAAVGDYSFAAGCMAKADHDGAFVWADHKDLSSCADFISTAPNQFLVRANGGVGINTNVPHAALSVSSSNPITTGENTATFYALNIGPNHSHIHYGPTGDWYIRSASNAGKVILQDGTAGNVGIGTITPTFKLDVTGKVHASLGFNGECLNATSFMSNNGTACNMDVAEGFAAAELTDPGDLVALVTDASSAPTVRKSTGVNDELLVGIVSENPGLVFDNGATHLAGDNSQLITQDKTVVALVGRVNVKVSMRNGAIKVGDPLTSSS
ncbi:MAG TPA: hypothetical protein VIX58_09705, partial [Anaerolineae bacterium]